MPIYELDGHRPEFPDENEYWVAPTAVLVGKIRLEKMASIWFGAVLRGDNELIHIGENSNVQENCVFHTDMGSPLIIGADCTIGHKAMLHGCTVGNNSLIGMNATVLNNAVIGENSIVGANSLVTEGREFPPNSLIVGSPAKAVRTLDEASAAMLTKSAAHYVANWQRFSKGLKEL